jgi:hydroxymethylpyrimidine pyrophosphatase-like HAD family hydrolase
LRRQWHALSRIGLRLRRDHRPIMDKSTRPTVAGLERLADSGRKLLLVTGRKLDDLLKVLPQVELFDQVVAENGGLL